MIVQGVIVGAEPAGITIRVPYDPRYITQRWEEVAVDIPDGRRISPEQRRKAYALMAEIADWAGMALGEVKLTTKHDFVQKHLESLHRELFSLSNCDMTTARQFIDYLINFVLEFDVPLRVPLTEVCDDVQQAVYACLLHHKCVVCGKKCELHHVDKVGMGRDRREIEHLGMRCLPLCRLHHDEAHRLGEKEFQALYHLEPVEIDETIAREYRLGARKPETAVAGRRAAERREQASEGRGALRP